MCKRKWRASNTRKKMTRPRSTVPFADHYQCACFNHCQYTSTWKLKCSFKINHGSIGLPVYCFMISFLRVIWIVFCIWRNVIVPDTVSLKGLTSYATLISIFQISHSFVDRQHTFIRVEMSVIVFTRLHVVAPQKTPILTASLAISTSILQLIMIMIKIIFLYYMCLFNNHDFMFRAAAWAHGPQSGKTILCEPSLVSGSGTACEYLVWVCGDQDSAQGRWTC
jgi:hypothetical protein